MQRYNDSLNAFCLVVGIIVVLCVIALGIELSQRAKLPSVETTYNYPLMHYEVVYIEGMPCIIVGGESITCDWSKWRGDQTNVRQGD